MSDYNVWDDVPSGLMESEESKIDRMQINKDFVATFSTECGQRVLAYFKKHTLDIPSWVPGSIDGQCQWREGQNSIVREIIQRVQNATEHRD